MHLTLMFFRLCAWAMHSRKYLHMRRGLGGVELLHTYLLSSLRQWWNMCSARFMPLCWGLVGCVVYSTGMYKYMFERGFLHGP